MDNRRTASVRSLAPRTYSFLGTEPYPSVCQCLWATAKPQDEICLESLPHALQTHELWPRQCDVAIISRFSFHSILEPFGRSAQGMYLAGWQLLRKYPWEKRKCLPQRFHSIKNQHFFFFEQQRMKVPKRNEAQAHGARWDFFSERIGCVCSSCDGVEVLVLIAAFMCL